MKTDWIHVFRTGWHTDSRGVTRYFTRADLDRAINTYAPARYEPPAVIGHPKMDDPAYGWMDGVRRKGEDLHVKLKKVYRPFWDAVESGRFPKRSIAFFPDGRIRHIGFLGAWPPAVDGLSDDGLKRAFSKAPPSQYFIITGGVMAKKKKKKKKGGDFQAFALQNADDQGVAFGIADIQNLYNELAEEKAAREAAEDKLKKLKKKASKQSMEFAAPTAENMERLNTRIDDLVKDGKITKAMAPQALAFASVMSNAPQVEVEIAGKRQTMEDHFFEALDQKNPHSLFFAFGDLKFHEPTDDNRQTAPPSGASDSDRAYRIARKKKEK